MARMKLFLAFLATFPVKSLDLFAKKISLRIVIMPDLFLRQSNADAFSLCVPGISLKNLYETKPLIKNPRQL